jgi:hypothetical protein
MHWILVYIQTESATKLINIQIKQQILPKNYESIKQERAGGRTSDEVLLLDARSTAALLFSTSDRKITWFATFSWWRELQMIWLSYKPSLLALQVLRWTSHRHSLCFPFLFLYWNQFTTHTLVPKRGTNIFHSRLRVRYVVEHTFRSVMAHTS